MTEDQRKTSFSQKFRQIFIAGVLACLPFIVTIYLILFLYRLLTRDLIPLITKLAAGFHYSFPPYLLQFSALIAVLIFIFCVGLVARAYVGGRLLAFIDRIMAKIPVARTIYNATKQVIDSFGATGTSSFSKVVLVEFPRKEMWMIGFIVKDAQEFMAEISTKEESYNVFIPTAPNPTSGFIALVGKSQIKELDISVEDGVKFVFSVGLVNSSPLWSEKELKRGS